MEEKDFNALIEKVKGAIGESEAVKQLTTDIANLKNDALTPDQFTEKMEAFAKDNDISGLKESIEKIGVGLKKLQESGPVKEEAIRDRLLKNHDALKRMAQGTKESFILNNVKTDVLRSNVSGSTQAYRIPGVNEQAYAATILANLFTPGTIGPDNNGTIRYVDQNAITRNADTVAEAAQFPESAITWIERNLPVQKIGDTIPVTHEAMMDVDFISGELNKLLNVNVALKEDGQIWSGDGTPPNLVGAYTTATTFNAATMAAKKQDASIYDLIRSVKVQITNGKESKYMPNFVVMNPEDVDTMQSKKDANNNYVMPPWVSNDGMIINGMPIVESPTVTQNTMMVGDFRHGTYWQAEGFEIEVGWVANQFIEDMMTLKARKRAALLIKTADITAFYKVTDITAALTSMTA